MTTHSTLNKRLSLLRIDSDTKYNIGQFRPLLDTHMDDIIHDFYGFITSRPEGRAVFEGSGASIEVLKTKQKSHWQMLFSCNFDEAYSKSAMAVGAAHYRSRVAPYLYIASYNFFLCELIKLASDKLGGDFNFANVLTSISKIVHLDMDLALSIYTREHWRRGDPDAAEGDVRIVLVDPPARPG